jgi:pyruvate-ferredoxin/flavodoxin oxidoreductase
MYPQAIPQDNNAKRFVLCMQAIPLLKQAIRKSYSKQGEQVVAQNHAAVDAALSAVVKVDIPATWAQASAAVTAVDERCDDAAAAAGSTPTALAAKAAAQRLGLGDYYSSVMQPMLSLQADGLPVSAFKAGNIMPPGEHRVSNYMCDNM